MNRKVEMRDGDVGHRSEVVQMMGQWMKDHEQGSIEKSKGGNTGIK